MTVLAVNLPIKVVGALYDVAIDEKRNIAVLVLQALENFLNERNETSTAPKTNDKPKRKEKVKAA
jgi:hypothetical protein